MIGTQPPVRPRAPHRPGADGGVFPAAAWQPQCPDGVFARRPHAVMLSFGDPRPHAAVVKAAGCPLICQGQDLASALLAREAGADFVVAQGTEAGEQGGTCATLPPVPTVLDAVDPIPVLAAGGIADGRGLAAALALDAQGAFIGNRFYASDEALGSPRAKQSIVEGCADGTQRTTVFDFVRGVDGPAGTTGRALRNPFMARWRGHERELAAVRDTESAAFPAAVRMEDFDTAMVWAGEDVDRISAVAPAGTFVRRISEEAEQCLAQVSGLCRPPTQE